MAKFGAPSKNVEDRRKAKVYPTKRERREINYREYKKHSEDTGLSKGPTEEIDKRVERRVKSDSLRNTNADRQSDVVRDTKPIRKRISEDYQKFISKK